MKRCHISVGDKLQSIVAYQIKIFRDGAKEASKMSPVCVESGNIRRAIQTSQQNPKRFKYSSKDKYPRAYLRKPFLWSLPYRSIQSPLLSLYTCHHFYKDSGGICFPLEEKCNLMLSNSQQNSKRMRNCPRMEFDSLWITN